MEEAARAASSGTHYCRTAKTTGTTTATGAVFARDNERSNINASVPARRSSSGTFILAAVCRQMRSACKTTARSCSGLRLPLTARFASRTRLRVLRFTTATASWSRT